MVEKYDLIKMGKYLDCNLYWYVLDIDRDKALLLCKDIVDFMPFGNSQLYNDSRIRNFLNYYFYDSSFTLEEKSNILDTNLKLGDNKLDKVFIFSKEEAIKYFSQNKDIVSAKSLENINIEREKRVGSVGGTHNYWLRTKAEYVDVEVYYISNYWNSTSTHFIASCYGVRPAMYIKINNRN